MKNIFKDLLQKLEDVENYEYTPEKRAEELSWTKEEPRLEGTGFDRRVTLPIPENITKQERMARFDSMIAWLVDNVGAPLLIEVNEFGDVIESEFAGDGWEIDYDDSKWIIRFANDRDASMFLIRWS